MKYKRFFRSAAAGVLCLVLLYLVFSGELHRPGLFRAAGRAPECSFRTSGKVLQMKKDGAWEDFTMVGVNMGTGYPGLFPNEIGISEDTYYRWFTQIGEMNANTIRVYQLQSPAFYTALLHYNQSSDRPIYLLQGVDFPEQLMYSQENILELRTHKELFEDTVHTVNALHGDFLSLDSGTDRLHVYCSDVSPYVLGYILGVEWDEMYVEYTCRINEGTAPYSGTYLTCRPDANPFESFLAQWGDHLISHETARYGVQHLITFSNWPDTDPLVNELHTVDSSNWQQFQETPVDVERILSTGQNLSGIFASYNVYPYFPSFLQYGPYTAYRDETGTQNPYRAYLMALTEHHRHPVVITEFGVPASRSMAYGELWRNFSHGGLTETEQGNAVAALFHDIQKAGCAGSLVFTWQDEWYKTVWNEKLISDPDYRAFWSNAQCPEQGFGLLAFEPGASGTTCYPDGDLSDWKESKPVYQQGGLRLSIRQDEKYLYFLAQGSKIDSKPLHIALDTLPEHGVKNLQGAEFIIHINPHGESGLYVDNSYDLLSYSALGGYEDTSLHSMQQQQLQTPKIPFPGHPEMVLVSRASGDIYSRINTKWIVNAVGKLTAGNTNPQSPEYSPNADYCMADNAVEIRIPWQLLNFTDPSRCMIADNLPEHRFTIQNKEIHRIRAAAYFENDKPGTFGIFPLSGWEKPQWHERLKQSYFILQDVFGGVN